MTVKNWNFLEDSDLAYSIIKDNCGDKYTKTKFESDFFSTTSIQISYTGKWSFLLARVATESLIFNSAFTFVSSSDLSQQSVSCAVTICEPGVTCPEEPVCDDDSQWRLWYESYRMPTL